MTLNRNEKTPTADELLLPREAAAYLRVNRSTIWRWQRDGLLGFIRVGNSVRIRRSDLDAFIAAGERKAAVHNPRKSK